MHSKFCSFAGLWSIIVPKIRAALLAHLGFEREGLAKRSLKIDGAWANQAMTSLINPSDRD